MSVSDKVKSVIRDVPDFPKPGILFKDITPVLADTTLVHEIVQALVNDFKPGGYDAIVGIESRGFIFGSLLAYELEIPFIPVRKAGKLPFHTLSESYDLEYGQATIEIHKDALKPGSRVLIHDDLLATGGTAAAAARLVHKLGAEATDFSFLINLSFLKGDNILFDEFGVKPNYLISY
jgi:adenine phosphoribosyltransferase